MICCQMIGNGKHYDQISTGDQRDVPGYGDASHNNIKRFGCRYVRKQKKETQRAGQWIGSGEKSCYVIYSNMKIRIVNIFCAFVFYVLGYLTYLECKEHRAKNVVGRLTAILPGISASE